MKRAVIILSSLLIITTLSLASCGSAEKKQETPAENAKEQYQCPMKCTEELFDKPGNCSVCGMEIEKITKS